MTQREHADRRLTGFVLLLVAAAATVPFLGKALHIDDAADIQYVQQILRAPLDPYGFEFDWGEGPRPAIHNYHPPLKFYYHAAVLWLAGGGRDVYRYPSIELILHLSYVPFVVATVFSLAFLAAYFRAPVLAVAAMWTLGPGYLPGQNAMLDVPALALGLSGTALLARALHRPGERGAGVAGLVLALALLTKYATAIFACFWALWLFVRRVRWSVWFRVFGPAVAGMVVWSVLSYVRYGWIHPLVVLRGVPGQTGAQAPGLVGVIDSLVFLGGALPGVLLFGLFASARSLISILVSLTVALGLYVVRDPRLYVVEGRTELMPENLLWWLWLATTGVFCVIEGGAAIVSGLKREGAGEDLLLGGWMLGALVLGAAAAPFVAMRRVLDAAAAATILTTRRHAGAIVPRGPVRKAALPAAVFLNVCLGYVVAYSDLVFADVYPDFAHRIASQQPRFQQHAWSYGYWGWMYYSIKHGLKRYVPGRDEPAVGDMFVWPDTVAKPAVIPERLMARLRRIFQEYCDSYAPARLMSKQAGAGFYSNAWGPLPYAWSRLPLEVLNAAVVEEEPQ